MKILKDYPVLVLVGNWNHAIFQKEWVSKFLLPQKELKVEFPFNERASQRITSDVLRIYTMGDKLCFAPLKTDTNTLGLIEELALKLADLLPHTPVKAFGINFKYEENSNQTLLELLETNEANLLAQMYGEIKNSNVRHTFEFDGKLINLDLARQNEHVVINLNFHFDIKDLVEFKEKYNENEILELKKLSENILQDIYNLD
jgi:hypothetical protein